MAKKRKTSSRSKEPDGPNLDVGESRKRIRTYEDVADSDDEFHDSRDTILLDEQPGVKRRRKWDEQEQFLHPSDEEVLDYTDEDEDEDEGEEDQAHISIPRKADPAVAAESSGEEERDDEEEEGYAWGTSKSDLYGADAIETEEQALEEEAEALRLQKNQIQAMTAADYGFDESDWKDGPEADNAATDGDGVVTEVLPQLQIAEGMSSADKMQLLKARYPEFLPLSQDLIQLQKVHADFGRHPGTGSENVRIKSRAASAYLGSLVMYFALLTSTASDGTQGTTALPATKLRDHPIMYTLMACRTFWQLVEHLPEDDGADDSGIGGSETAEKAIDVRTVAEPTDAAGKEERQPQMSRAQRHAAAAQAAAQARKAERLERTEAGLADLDRVLASSTLKKRKRRAEPRDDESDMGEEAPLSAHEAAEKARRKKSLRFYTSQIAQKANKRGASGRNAGGDEDIPHRERLRDRQERLNAEAEKRGKRRADEGTELGGESDEEDLRQARQMRAEAAGGDYYDVVAKRTAKKKAERTALAEAQKRAALEGGRVVEEETVGADGKRKISYMIEKNKGLTPFRKKDVRNPRVKKRKKFEEKKKKLGSIKAVYKGGEGRGGYGGELTGIKKGLVKSTKL